jgi:hypothetical protein
MMDRIRQITPPLFLAIQLLLATCANAANMDLAKQVEQLRNQGDIKVLGNLINAEEARWQSAPNLAYFENMQSIGETLIDGTTNESYWLGRQVLWKSLLKASPNEYLAPKQFYLSRYVLFSQGAENITPFVDKLDSEQFASVRHDTFLMLIEYARQLHASIISGYVQKFPGAANDPPAKKKKLIQNEIDNEIQYEARRALSLLATDHLQYLMAAYSRAPRDDQELKALLDALNVQGKDRAEVWQDTR